MTFPCATRLFTCCPSPIISSNPQSTLPPGPIWCFTLVPWAVTVTWLTVETLMFDEPCSPCSKIIPPNSYSTRHSAGGKILKCTAREPIRRTEVAARRGLVSSLPFPWLEIQPATPPLRPGIEGAPCAFAATRRWLAMSPAGTDRPFRCEAVKAERGVAAATRERCRP